MTLRGRLLLAQAPLALALVLLGVMAVVTLGRVGRSGQQILEDNYRSVLATQRMTEQLERMDSAALFIVAGDRERGVAQQAEQRPRLESELRVQEGNITEPGEAEATRRMRTAWERYRTEFDTFLEAPDAARTHDLYFKSLAPAFQDAKRTAAAILDLNQDAMVRKSELLSRQSQRVNTLMVLAVVAALGVGLFFSTSLVHRAVRPVMVLSQAVRRLGQGDYAARAVVDGRDEMAQLGRDINTLAERLDQYRQSSLGELLQAQAVSQAAIDSLPDPVVVLGAEGDVLNVNRAGEDVLRLRLEGGGDVLGRVVPEVREVLERVRAHVVGGHGAYQPRGYEEAVRVEAADGARWLLPRGSPVYGETGDVVGATLLLQDVTRLRRFDELKNDLVATVAHEFRTPLTSLRMAIHLVAEGVVGPVTEKQADLMFAAREDCERLQGIVDDLLDLSRIQGGQLLLDVKLVRTEELVESALDTQRGAASERGVHLLRDVSLDAETVSVDPDRMQLVLGNLVGNAVKHTQSGGEVLVRVTPEEQNLRFEVRDTGEGIPAEQQAKIFEKFYRAPGAPAGGAGLGLSIAKEIVQAHGGTIGVVSEPGQGSTFWFTIPKQA
ncbi:PAS domain-containing sensor histidine kinase [Corallococcus sp. H22C18031201]|uniref:HAMP domain-containing sensor histidine kinase n=1 Tax=Citreicoccus inhibens TaxID=2849499 RepID=UPI000E722FD4|nr:ATP-binding protein [Citreicoccus inhibens]MBU8898515.1 HAMP domain-containing protein [Citreicoccus inhibens]RJS21354.1 PAS domain-containing sensor histidine kinase [Corallococcus sp. H22C18031201]